MQAPKIGKINHGNAVEFSSFDNKLQGLGTKTFSETSSYEIFACKKMGTEKIAAPIADRARGDPSPILAINCSNPK